MAARLKKGDKVVITAGRDKGLDRLFRADCERLVGQGMEEVRFRQQPFA